MSSSLFHTPSETAVKEAAERIVTAFAATDTVDYFSCFAPECSFVFHSEPARLDSRIEYESLWKSWLGQGWRVLSCVSSNQGITVFPGGAVFVHDVQTTVWTGSMEDSYLERETIVFRTGDDGGLTAVHEHLSPAPAA